MCQKLQWIVYFTATLKQKLIFYFYYEKESLTVWEWGKNTVKNDMLNPPKQTLTVMVRDNPQLPGRIKAAETVASPLL